MPRALLFAALTPMMLLGCASPPGTVGATYLSPSFYAHRSCQEIVTERARVGHEVSALTVAQQRAATSDAVAAGVGALLFPPALFAIGAAENDETRLATLKGDHAALSAAGREKGCFG